MTAPSPKEALDKQIYYLESIYRQLKEYSDFVSSCEVLAPSIGNEVLAGNIDWLDCYIDELKATLATKPDGERRGVIMRALCCSDGCLRGNDCIAEAHAPGIYERRRQCDAILASGLAQDEAAIRADEREKCAKICDELANNFAGGSLIDPNTHTGRKIAKHIAAAIRSARDGDAS